MLLASTTSKALRCGRSRITGTALRGTRKFPSRADFAPVNLKRLLRHVSLLRVIDGGADYGFRIVGEVQVQAYGENFRGMKLSEVGERHPKFAEALKILYDGVRMGGAAFGYRGWIGRDMPDTKYSYPRDHLSFRWGRRMTLSIIFLSPAST